MQNDDKESHVLGVHGRDANKVFYVQEVLPVPMAGYVLRLVSALRVASYEELLERVEAARAEGSGGLDIDIVMRVLQGADPLAVHTLIKEALQHVQVAADPQHPGVRRQLLPDFSDIREQKTLGDVLMAFVRLHFDLDF